MDKTLKSALNKTKRNIGREYYGYLTTIEMLAMIKDGAKFINGHNKKVAYLNELKENGISSPNWQYFTLGKTSPTNP